MCQNSISTKTRIETRLALGDLMNSRVKIQYPLKQGLKPNTCTHNVYQDGVKIQYPLKQGLKQHGLRLVLSMV